MEEGRSDAFLACFRAADKRRRRRAAGHNQDGFMEGKKRGGQNRSLNVQFTIDGINIDKPRLAEKMNSTFISRPNMQVEVSSPRSLIFVHLPQILYGSLFRTQRGEKEEVPCLVTVRRVGWTQRPEGAMSVWEKL